MINTDGKVYSYGRNNLGQCGRNKDEESKGEDGFEVRIGEVCESIGAGT